MLILFRLTKLKFPYKKFPYEDVGLITFSTLLGSPVRFQNFSIFLLPKVQNFMVKKKTTCGNFFLKKIMVHVKIIVIRTLS